MLFFQAISILDAIEIVARVWATKVKCETIQNCFRKAGFMLDSEDDIPLAVLANRMSQGDIMNLSENIDYLTSYEFNEYCDIDDGVVICNVMTDSEIIESISDDILISENNSSVEEQRMEVDVSTITSANVQGVLSSLHNILLNTENVSTDMFGAYFKMEEFLKRAYV